MDAEYDVALSFAGEDREYVESVAAAVKELGIRVFYDRFEEADLWGKDLVVHFEFVYRKRARYCVIFVSEAYKRKVWTRHELRTALSRSIEQHEEYLLPARFDDSELDGLRPSISTIDLRSRTPQEFAQLIARKVRNETQPTEAQLITPKLEGVVRLSIHDSFGVGGTLGPVAMGLIVRCTITNKLADPRYRYFENPVFKLKEPFKGRTAFQLTNLDAPVKFPLRLEYGEVRELDFVFQPDQAGIWEKFGPTNWFVADCATTIGERFESEQLSIETILEHLEHQGAFSKRR